MKKAEALVGASAYLVGIELHYRLSISQRKRP